MRSEVKASQDCVKFFVFPISQISNASLPTTDDLERSFFFTLVARKTYVKLEFSGKFHEAARDFQSVKIQFRATIESENDDKSDQNSIESGSKSINETNEAKIAEFLLEIN